MDNQNGSPSWATRDITVPLLISGVVSTCACIFLGVAVLVYNDPGGGDPETVRDLLEPTPVVVPLSSNTCPGIPTGWTAAINEGFLNNENRWSSFGDTENYANVTAQIQDGLYHWDVLAGEGVHYVEAPYWNATTKDFMYRSLPAS